MLLSFCVKQFPRLVFSLFLVTFLSGLTSLPSARAQEIRQTSLDQFDLLTPNSGWVLMNRHLFWSSDAGQTWKETGPSIPPDALVQDVEFIDLLTGWVLWTTPDPQGGASFHLDQTRDGGETWETGPLSLFEPGEAGSYVEKAEMSRSDAQTGWISVKQLSGSNFSIGALFTTSDGGTQWRRSALPVADTLHFSDAQSGWAIGGPTEDRIFNTQDAGLTWNDARPSDLPVDVRAVPYPPFVSEQGSLLIVTVEGNDNSLRAYSMDASGSWTLFGEVKLESEPGRIGISILDAQNFVAAIPGTSSIVLMTNGKFEVLKNQDDLSASISELDMISLEVGWAKSIEANCSESRLPDEAVTCSSFTRLLQTTNGGRTWEPVNLPNVPSDPQTSLDQADSNPAAASAIPMLENTEVAEGQGFDKCEIPSLSQMQTWWNASPYGVVNLYIGGSSRACANSVLSSTYLSQLYQQGWKFIPTWVGPQAPCTGYPSRMSSDVTVAYQQGVSEADLAVERLAALGLTKRDKTGSVVYYDIEHYGTDSLCRSAVNAFMNGWVAQLHARGNLAGVYGSTLCNTGISDFRFIANVPDVIWPARWYHNLGAGYYDPNASVWNLGSCIPNTVWANQQRIRQYEGDHNELWGGLMLAIDSNVLDGVVAIPERTPVEVHVGGNVQGTHHIVPNQTKHQTYPSVSNGPVKIVNAESVSLIGSERVIHKVGGTEVSFTEMMALPDRQLDTIYWLPWYNNVELDTQLRFANVSGTTATIHITIGEVEMPGSPFSLAPGASTRKSFPGVNDGPVKIESNVKVIAAERVVYRVNGTHTSFSEMMALPNTQLDTTYWLPWYNNATAELDTQLRFGNVSGSTARVRIYIGGQEMTGSPFTLAPGESTRQSFTGVSNGPVRIVSNVEIVVAERVIYKVNGVDTSFIEMMGMPNHLLDKTYWFPWYDNANLDTQLRFANVSGSTATVRVYIGGIEMPGSPFTMQPGESTRRSFHGVNNGPVKVISTQNIVAAERLVYKANTIPTSFSEMMGLPASQLDTTYWLPWYNSIELDTQLRFGVP